MHHHNYVREGARGSKANGISVPPQTTLSPKIQTPCILSSQQCPKGTKKTVRWKRMLDLKGPKPQIMSLQRLVRLRIPR